MGLGFEGWGLGFEVWGLGFEVWGLGFEDLDLLCDLLQRSAPCKRARFRGSDPKAKN